jgi:hypothetical protein
MLYPYIPFALCKPAGAKISGVALGKPIEFPADTGNRATGNPIERIRVAPIVSFPETQGGCAPEVAAGNPHPAIT